MICTTRGIDLAKQVFQLHGVDERGQVVGHCQMLWGGIVNVIDHCLT